MAISGNRRFLAFAEIGDIPSIVIVDLKNDKRKLL
jgi:hypothetical protein